MDLNAQESYQTIAIQDEFGGSGFVFDLRNSTSVTRRITWDKRLHDHFKFMMRLHETVHESVFESAIDQDFALNDTGDGYLCVFWDPDHSVTCLKAASLIRSFLITEVPKHNRKLDLKKEKLLLDFGFAFHTGGITVGRANFRSIHKDFIFGIVPNTVSRLESFNKYFNGCRYLATGNFKLAFSEQAKSNSSFEKLFETYAVKMCDEQNRLIINDGKEHGHIIYRLKDDFFPMFLNDG